MDKKELKKEKIKSWLRDKHNLYFLGILAFAIVIRLYYFILTKSQPLWWDEAEYMLRAKAWVLHTPLTGYAVIREGIIPFFWGVLYFFSRGEWLIRFFQVVISSATVFFTFVIAKKMFERKIALLATFFMSVYCIHLFFTARILTYLWVPLIYLIVLFFFFKRNENKKYLYISMGLLAFCIVIYFSSLFLLVLMFLMLFIEQKGKMFKKKENWVALLIFLIVLSPFVGYYLVTKGVPLPRFIQLQQISSSAGGAENLPFSQWWGYFKDFPRELRINNTYLSTTSILFLWLSKFLNLIWFIVLIFSIYSLIELFLGFDLLLEGKSERLKNIFFLWIWIFIPIFFYTFIEVIQGGSTFYDAFVLPIFPAIFMLCAISVNGISTLISKNNKKIAMVFVVLIVIWVGFIQIKYANEIIIGKKDSFIQIKNAGLFLKEKSIPGDRIISAAIPMITYYSERETLSFPEKESEMIQYSKENNAKFVVTSFLEQRSADWTYSWYQNNQNKSIPINVQVTTLPIQGVNQEVPTTIVFQLNNI
jgi:4-amino-4-deoxy-L-arabinose transferase-like glycosyltransferase